MPRISVQRSKIKLPEESVETLAKNTKLSKAEVQMIAKEVAKELLKIEKEEDFNRDLKWQYDTYSEQVDEKEIFRYHIMREITEGFEKLVPSEFNQDLENLQSLINTFDSAVKVVNAKFFQSHEKLSFEDYQKIMKGT